jgi:hypothetical protein
MALLVAGARPRKFCVKVRADRKGEIAKTGRYPTPAGEVVAGPLSVASPIHLAPQGGGRPRSTDLYGAASRSSA